MKFALLGAAGYIAPRHMKAIKETGNTLVAALDPNDSVGILDQYFPETHFFTEFERFDRHVDKLRRSGNPIDYMSICSPNYLHDSHIRFALRSGAHAVCEKPLVLNPWNLDALEQFESEYKKQIFTILQLRHHPTILDLKSQHGERTSTCEIELTYITSRGRWYLQSWKGLAGYSGGIATNIGIHFFDMLHWVYGETLHNWVHLNTSTRMAGCLELERAKVKWFLSIDAEDLPENCLSQGQRTFRSITIDGESLEFSSGFTDLHTLSYQSLLEGKGFGIKEARPSIQTVYDIRSKENIDTQGEKHSQLAK